MKTCLATWLLISFCLVCTASYSQSADVAFITQLKGTAVVGGIGQQRNAVALTKLQDGEQVTLSKESQLRIVYFDGGRQETWSGNAQLSIGSAQSTKSAGAEPEVKKISSILSKQLAMTPTGEATSRVGMVRLRTASEAKVKEVEKNYAELRGEAPGDDSTPELYLLAALFQLGRYDQIESTLASLKSRQTESSEVDAIAERYAKAIAVARKATKATH